jgi:nitrous oxidase accessory protein
MTITRCAVVLAGALIASAVRVDARTWTVGGPAADFPFIGPALGAAGDGDVILVRPGVYREDLVITRRVRLLGKGWPLIIGTGAGTVIELRASRGEIRGLRIEGSGTGAANAMDAGVHVMGEGNTVAGNRMRRVFYGVVVIGASGNEIAGNDIVGLSDLPFGQRGDGVYVFRAPDTRVMHNRVAGMRDAIYFQYATRGVALGNEVEASRYGLHDMFSDEARIENNVFRGCSVGANIMNSHGVTVRQNRIERNRGIASVGMSLKQCDGSRFEDNLIVNNVRGLLVDGSSTNQFLGNRFVANDTAVTVLGSAEANVFSENVFEANWSDVVTSGAPLTRWSAGGRGNLWDRYRAFDFDEDGVGDVPHPLVGAFEKIEGRQASVRLLLHSPAAAALELAASVGFTLGAGADEAPLVRLPDSGATASRRPSPLGAASGILTFAVLLGAAVREATTCSR